MMTHKLTLTNGNEVEYHIVMTLTEFYNARMYELTYCAYHDGKSIEVSDIDPDNIGRRYFEIRQTRDANLYHVAYEAPIQRGKTVPGSDPVYIELISIDDWQSRINRTNELMAEYAPKSEAIMDEIERMAKDHDIQRELYAIHAEETGITANDKPADSGQSAHRTRRGKGNHMTLTDMETDEIINSLIGHIQGRMKELEADNRELRKHVSNLAEFAVNNLGDLDTPPPYEEMRVIWNTIALDGMNAKRYLESKKRTQP